METLSKSKFVEKWKALVELPFELFLRQKREIKIIKAEQFEGNEASNNWILFMTYVVYSVDERIIAGIGHRQPVYTEVNNLNVAEKNYKLLYW